MSISHSNRDCGKFDALPLPALFEAQVRRTPQATALWYEGITVSYAELNLRANRVAHILIDAGIGPEDIVALALPRSIELVAVLLAILKAGAAYLPLDPEYPPERLAFMLEDATPAALITTEALVPAMPSARNTIVFDSREFEARLAQSQTADPTDEERSAALHCANLAYVIYTSGSTGKPKGVMVTHAGIANLAASQIERFAISPDSAILQFASVSFDAAVSELCIAVLAGARLVLAPASRLLPGDALANLIAQAGVTHATLPPSALAVMPHDALPTGFTLIVAGEACPLHLVQSWSRGRRMINAYGPTETTVCATMSAPLDGSRTPPLGEAVANTDIYLLDEFLEPVPPGVPGELYVSGIGLARGYRGRPDLTAERFLPDPHFADGRRMYRTGDLVCRAQDGTLDFLGRIDHQVKIRGFRIELGEIEAALARHPDVLQAAVIAREDSQGQKQIVGYVVAAPGAAPDSAALRRHVGLQLPDYMVPAAILALAAIPLTPNGKLDREKLPDPVFSGTGRSEAASREETMLAALFAEVLSLEQVDMEESFFDLGGHSLAATRLISRIRSTFGVKLELDDIFDTPNVAGLAVRLGGAPAVEKQAAGIARTSRETPLALSFSQQRLWFLDQMAPGSPFYNMPCLVKLSGALDRALVQRSLDEIVRRHESLRTTFVAGDGEPVQVVGPAFAVSLPYTDLSTLTEAEREPRAQELALAQKRTAFDLATGPLIRAELLRLEQRQHLLMLTVHHTVGDGWSMGLLVNELTQLYQAYESNAPSPLAELPIQYADYAQWQRRHVDGDLLATQLDYWKSKLAGSPALIALPTDKPRPAVQSFSGSAHLDCTLPVGLSASLHAFAARHNATLFMAILAALDALLMRWSGQSDLVVGTVIAGRTSEELEPMIGCFINFLPLRATCNADDTPSALIAQLAATVREAYANQDTPFEKITEAVKPVRDAGHNPIFNVGLLLQNFPEPASAQGQLHTEMLPIAQDTATLDLRFVAQETAHGLHLSCEYRTDLFEQSTIVALLDALHASLAYCAGRPDAPLLELSLPAGLVQQGATRREIVPETLKLAIAATFTSEPLAETLSYWMRQCALEADIEFAPYNQVMQTLLDPQGAFAARRNDVNIVLVRIEDWLRYADSAAPAFDIMQQRADDLLDAVAEAAARLGAPLLVGFCRASAAILAQPEMARHIAQLEQRMVARLRETAGVYPVPSEESARLYPVEHYDDVHGDELGHVPYTPEMFTALATLLARKVFTLHSRPFKVVVLDCDETLWRGVCGESGPLGVEVTEEHRFLQRFMIEQFESGMLLCLASKNSAADVDAVFAQHPGMLLKADHIVASRVNWLPKSQNIRQLAQELQLGLDSFIFLDDNPLECAEVAANCPGVLVLQLPAQSARIPAFLDHVWAFDRLSVTADARQRTRQYKENREREAVRTISASFDEFLASLKLDVAISGLHAAQLERAAELTQRTNQFNLRPQPRNAAQLQALDAQCLIVEVRDRFGDYGLTGVVAYTVDGPALTVDTFLLSCRILGRGVEHKVLAHLAGAAQEAGCDAIALPYIETGRNQPVLNFLHSIVQPDGTSYRIPVATALALKPTQSTSEQPMPAAAEKQRPGAGKTLPHSAFYMRTASELNNAMRIAQDVADMARAARQSMPDAAHYTAPEGESEQAIAAIWAAMLHQDQIGRHANFFDLGGHSLLATQVVSKIRTAFHIDLPLRALFEHPTVAELAAALERRRGADPVADSVADPAVAPIPALPRNGPMPLSFAQQRLWFLDQFESGSALYNMPATLRLRGRLDVAALSRAFNDIVARHEALRTTFALVDETAHQVLAPHLAIAPVLVDLTSLPRDAREAEARRLALDEACRPFDLAAGPLLRVTIVRLREDGPESEHFLLFTMHHIVSDGWSMGILLKEIAALYAAHVQGLPVALPPLPIQYADFSQWQRQWLADGVLARQLDYWTAKLRGIPSLLALPTDRPRPAAKTYRGASLAFTLPAPVTAGLQALAKATHGTLFMTLAAAFNVLLARYSGQDDICIGTPIANRNRAEIEPLIGFFVNTLVLRAQVDPDASFMALLEQVRATALEAYANQDVPFEQLVDALNPERHVSHSPLFQVMLALQNVAIDDLQLPGVALQRADVDTGIAKFDLTLTLVEAGDCLQGSLEYNTDLFDRATADRMAAHFANLLKAIVAAPGARIAELDMLGAAERHTLLHVWNDTAADYPREFCIHQLFEAQVLRTPDAVALSCADASLSYAALNRRANRLAHHLRRLGIQPDTRVALLLERGIDLVTAMLATAKSGAAYVPLDPAYPPERLAFMLADSAPAAILSHAATSALSRSLPATAGRIDLDADAAQWRDQPESDPAAHPAGLSSRSLAYIIYTSGSTGNPKGVMVEHRNLVNLVTWHLREFALAAGERSSSTAGVAFDATTWEVWPPLSAGATLALPRREDEQNPEQLVQWWEREALDVSFLVTPLAEFALERGAAPTRLRRLLTGGDRLRHVPAHDPGFALINNYGPTETAVVATSGRIEPGAAVLHIGRPIANTSVYILDGQRHPVPTGVAGEIHIGGTGVARGYLNRPDLTETVFLPDPFSTEPDARMYKTGDLARWLPDGKIEYLGRNDFQVKIRGFRIELGEIESKLAKADGVRETVIVAHEDDSGDKHLVAYVVPSSGTKFDAAVLRAGLAAELADYMLPSAFVELAALPLTANGKIDRKALPIPGDDAFHGGRYEAPQGASEERLAALWQDVLKRKQVGRHANFFDLGGHSLLATQVVSKIRTAFHIDLPLRALFEHPTVAELAAALARRRGADPVADSAADPAVAPIPALPRNGPMPLSFAQQRLWFLDQFESGSALYNMPATLRLRGRLDVAALSRAFNDIVARHEALRTTFALVDETAHQVLAPHLAITPALVDLTSLPHDAREAEARRLALDEACRPFDLAAGPLLRVTIVRLREDGPESEHFLLFTMHHIVSDGWSMGILLKEIAALYAAHVQGLPVALPPLPIQYADFSQWQRQWLADGVLARQLDYWTAKLRGIPSLLALPTDRPRPAAKTYRGASLAFTLPAPVTAGLQALAKATHGTLFMTLAAAFNVLLARYSGQDDICIGTPIANRNRAEIEPLIGFFVNTLVLRAQVDPDASFMALLEQVRATALEAYANQDVPFEQLVDALNPERHVSHSPLFQVMLALQNVAIDDLQLPGVALQRADVDTGIAKFDLTLTLVEEGDCLHGSLEYNTDLFDRATAERMAAHFANLAGAIVAAPGTRIAELDMLGAAERHTLLHVWNDTAADYPRELCIHQLFEAQVLRTPDAIALSCADASLSYAALNRRANRLAHLLLEKGMARDQLVGICLERSIDSVVAVLATLKAGAAYVPLDPAYPLARLSYVVQDAALKIVVTQSAIATRMPFAEQNTLCLDDAGVRQALASQAETDIDAGSLGLEPGNLAYVIYTSGSTGRPKGVRAEHRAMVNRICWMERRFPSRPDDVFCHKTTIAFVDHVAEIFQPLMRGRRLVLVAQDDVTDTRNLIGTIERESITRITVVPSLLQAMLDDPAAPGMSGLRQIVSSGEALTVRLARHCKRILPATRLINLYGSTEIGADATWHEFGSLSDEHEVLRHFSTDVAAGSAIPHADAARPWRELAALFTDTAIPHAPLATKEYFQRLDEQVIPNLVDVSQASYIGHMTSKLPNFAPAIAELITGLNQNLVKIETSKAMTFIERQALAAMHRLFFGGDKSDYDSSTQDPMQVFGVLVSGGSVANVTALWYARNRALLGSGIAKADLLRQGYSASLHARGYKKGVILGTRLLHYSVKKAFSLFGLGQDCFIEVEQTEAMRMSVPDLERKIAQCQKNGYLILAVIGIAGATETGTVDPLADIAAVAARHGIHFHVDAAWGGAFQFSPTHSGRLAGIERADSITICAHKQLYLPQGISLCLFRDPRGAGAISTHAEYQAKEGSFDLGQYSLEGSKPANALHLHAGLHLLAHSGYAWLIDQGMAKTRYFVQLIEQSPAFELVGPYPDLNIVNYRYVPLALRNKPRLSRTVDDAASMNAAVETIQALQFEQGKTFVSRTRVLPAAGAGETVSVFRVVLSNPLTTKENLHEVLNDQLRIARSFIAGEEALPDTDFLAPPDAQTAPEDGLVPIGKPIQNARVYVLDRTRKLQPAGIVGELYVGGDCVARNYLNQPEQSAERFLPDPFSDAPGARMYRTGDLARWSADGTLEYLGRTDQQVKIRGLRIELNEIENVLSAHWSLKDVALAAHEAAAGGGQLIAYVVPEAGVEPGRYAEFIDALRNHAQQQLPEYMVPARFVILDALPLSPNGKVDRKALPAPEAGSGIDPQPGERIAPRDATEQRVAQIWAEVLKTGDIGATDNFFHLGGHSLLATVAISKLRNAFRADFPLRLMFEAPTVAALALRIGQIVAGQRDANWEEIRPAPRDGNLPLSFAQQRLWFLDQFESDKAVYNLSAAMRLTGELDVPALHRTLNDVVRRHDALRTRFSSNAGTPFQVVDAHLELPLAITDLTSLPHAEREAKVQWLAQDEARKPFDLEHGPLLRISLIRLRRDQHLFLFTIHHIVADGWSMQVLIRETAALYSAFIAGLPSPLPELSLQYGDFAQWQRKWLQGEVLERQLAYWKNKLAGIPSLLSLPTDAPRPAMQTFRGASRSFDVSRQTVASLHALSQRTQGTLFMTLAAALGVFLARYSGQRDICIGTPIANRNRAEIEPLIGFFVNTLVLRVAIDDEQPFADLLSQVRDTALEAYANQDVPFEQVVEAVKPERQISHSPLFQVMLILQNAGAGKLALPGVEMQPLDIENTVSKFDLSFTMVEEGEQLHASVEYNTDLFEPATMERMVRHFTRMLDAVAANAQMPTGDLPLLDDAEQRRQLYQWNDTATTYPVATPLHLMFEAQALATPQRVAMRAGAEEISYADLNRRANQLAHHLRSLGVAPDTLVAVCTERSVDMVVALLAVLKAGAAYVPLDPTYPAERLSHMLADARPKVLLTQHALAGYLPAGGAIALELDTQRELWASQPADNPSNRTLPNHLAYVIYTSGSTGKPKGVGVRQASLANFIHSMRRKPGIAADDVMLGLTSLSFDIAALELFLPLCAGAKLVLATREEASDPSCLLSLIEDNEVTIMQATPATWRMLVAHRWPMQQHMLRVLCGGEALPDDLARQLLERAGTVWNMYGPTETTIWSSVRCMTLADPAISIGWPIANTQFHILDERFHPAPVGVAGHLYIAGDGLARGYLNRPDLTAERFIPNPFGEKGSRMYDTGDVARYMPDGSVEYLGRMDGQVKVRGFRIETGEIESVLERLDTVHQAVVVARADQSGEKRLAAYIVAADSGNPPSVGALRAALAAALPEYMMPGHFMTLEALPQTPNGKIDRKALPAPDMMPVADDHIAPRTVAEVVLAGIWADVLQRERVGSSDNFFALGGHSLLAAVAMAKMRATFRVDLPLRSLFESPTLEAMAHRIDETLRTRQGSDAAPAQANVRPHTKAAERWVTLDDNLSKLDGPAGAAQNVLLIPGAGNGADIYKPISRALHEAGINVFLVHHDGVDNELAPQESIPEMIDKYAAQIGRHCAGRFAVAGYCIGGTIGYAVMRTLRGSAFRPNGLFLFDAAIPSADVLALIESQAASPFDENEHMRGFFRAICARYSKETQPIGGGDFLHMTEDACIARAIASMQLSSGSQTQEWAKVLRKRYRAERAHTMAIRNYWSSRKGSELDRSAWDACPLTVLQSDEMHAQSPANAQAMQELGFGGVRIEKVPGKHEGFLLDHHQAIVGALTGHAEQRIVDAA